MSTRSTRAVTLKTPRADARGSCPPADDAVSRTEDRAARAASGVRAITHPDMRPQPGPALTAGSVGPSSGCSDLFFHAGAAQDVHQAVIRFVTRVLVQPALGDAARGLVGGERSLAVHGRVNISGSSIVNS